MDSVWFLPVYSSGRAACVRSSRTLRACTDAGRKSAWHAAHLVPPPIRVCGQRHRDQWFGAPHTPPSPSAHGGSYCGKAAPAEPSSACRKLSQGCPSGRRSHCPALEVSCHGPAARSRILTMARSALDRWTAAAPHHPGQPAHGRSSSRAVVQPRTPSCARTMSAWPPPPDQRVPRAAPGRNSSADSSSQLWLAALMLTACRDRAFTRARCRPDWPAAPRSAQRESRPPPPPACCILLCLLHCYRLQDCVRTLALCWIPFDCIDRVCGLFRQSRQP